MRRLPVGSTCLLLLGLVGLATSADKDKKDDGKKKAAISKDKLVGVWETKDDNFGLTMTMEFTKDGKLKGKMTQGKDTKDAMEMEGTYNLKDDGKMDTVLKMGKDEKKETITIKSLDGDKMVTVDARGMEQTFTRMKDDKKDKDKKK